MSTQSSLRTTPFEPLVIRLAGHPITFSSRIRERSRLEWWLEAGTDPADLVADFLAGHGLGLPRGGADRQGRAGAVPGEVCGAALLISAAAAAAMVGAPAGPPSPASAVPDVAVVVFDHAAPGLGRDYGRPGELTIGDWTSSWSMRQHAGAVRAVRSAIARGDVYQVNLVGHASAPYTGDPVPALRRVAALAGAEFGGVLAGAGWAIASASPELLVRVAGGIAETGPIKGTRPATALGRRELLASTKERAEHIMIVDLARNDLARVAQTGTVRVPALFAVRRWCQLWQAESRVSARLASGVDLATVLRAVCPGGSVTGAPKLAALAQLAALEPVGRGPSMGALGWLDATQLRLGLTIRTVAADGARMHVWAGGGITWDSDPAAEVAEAEAKAAPIRAALSVPHPAPPHPAPPHPAPPHPAPIMNLSS